VDLGNIKNQLGTITQPNAVFIYSPFLGTLDTRNLKNGMAEIVKMALIADKKLITDLHDGKKQLEEIIFKSVILKAAIVKKDPLDNGIRKILNFGHTVGHAIEGILLGTKHELLHGEAIAIGMIIESFIALDKKLISKTDLTAVINLISPNYKLLKFTKTQYKTIFELIQHDKKNKNTIIRMSLLKGLGSCLFNQDVSNAQIEKAFANYTTLIES
jgi:3-dehydroquinate synthase